MKEVIIVLSAITAVIYLVVSGIGLFYCAFITTAYPESLAFFARNYVLAQGSIGIWYCLFKDDVD